MCPPSGIGEFVESAADETSGPPDHSGIVACERLAGDLRKVDAADKRPRIAARIDDIGENLIAAGGHIRQIRHKTVSRNRVRMKVPHGVQFRNAKKKEMHEVAMIRDDVT